MDLDVRVEIGFGANASMGDWFLLDSPERGLLDASELAPGTVWVDVTDSVAASQLLSAQRGRERYTDEPQAGHAQFVLIDLDRRFDPTAEVIAGGDVYSDFYTDVYTGVPAPFAGHLVPMRRVRISAVWPDGDSRYVWSGYIDQWPVDFHADHSEVTVPCVDGFAVLAEVDLAETSPSDAGDLPGPRITRALDEAGFPPTYELDVGVETLQATSYGENALQFVKRVAASDAGRLFVAADGTLRFRSRSNVQTHPVAKLGADIPVHEVVMDTTADQLWNRIVVGLEDGTEATSEDAQSRSDYLIRTRRFDRLMLANASRAEAYADLMLGRFARPKPRVASASIKLGDLTVEQQKQVLSIELGDLVQVEFATRQGGFPYTSLHDGIVEGIKVNVAERGDWVVVLSLSSTDATPYLRLSDSFFGQLDENVLAF